MREILLRCIHLSLLITIIFSAIQAFAYPVTIKNATSQEIYITIKRGHCSSLDDSVKAGETKTIEANKTQIEVPRCCPMIVFITTPYGPTANAAASYRPPDREGSPSCLGYSITVLMTMNGLLEVKEGIH